MESDFLSQHNLSCDFLVIGSGAAGLHVSYLLSKLGSVTLISKGSLVSGASNLAQGGIAAFSDKLNSIDGSFDSLNQHIQDTLVAGCYLNNPGVVDLVVSRAGQCIETLIELGMPFSRENDQGKQRYHLYKEGGHSFRRVWHVKDSTGQNLVQTLIKTVLSNDKIKIVENSIAIDLITDNLNCYGVVVATLDEKTQSPKSIYYIYASATVIATGGASNIYSYSTSPKDVTGDGIAMAYRAGCKIANMEFQQFHPTGLYNPASDNSKLITESIRGEGAILLNSSQQRFMHKYDKRLELSPRDIVARAIYSEIKNSDKPHIYLDARGLGANKIKSFFRRTYNECMEGLGLDITKDLVPVIPSSHYTCGGISVDHNAMTGLANLYAIGECSHTGLHGANRLASNSLIECLAFANIVKENIEKNYTKNFTKLPHLSYQFHYKPLDSISDIWIKSQMISLQKLMSSKVGIIRSNQSLNEAKQYLEEISKNINDKFSDIYISRYLIELKNLVLVSQIATQSALKRKESRGAHYCIDFPNIDESLCYDTVIKKESSRKT